MLEKGGNVRKVRVGITTLDPHKQRLIWHLLFCLIKYNNKRKTRLTFLLIKIDDDALA